MTLNSCQTSKGAKHCCENEYLTLIWKFLSVVDPCGQLVCRTNVCIFFTAQINPGRLNRFECKSLNLWLGLGSVIACYVMLVWYVPHLVGKMLSDIMSMKWFKFLITATLLMYEILFWWVLIISFVFDSKNSVIII